MIHCVFVSLPGDTVQMRAIETANIYCFKVNLGDIGTKQCGFMHFGKEGWMGKRLTEQLQGT